MEAYAEKLAEITEKQAQIRKWARRIKKTGLSREAWASQEGIDPGQLSKWINGKAVPSWRSIGRVEDALAAFEKQSKKKPL